MGAYSWDDKYLTGHGEIDDEHRQLFAILNQLHDALKGQRGELAMLTTLDELARYAVRHFATEERLMTEYAYPEGAAHCRLHQDFTRQLTALRRRAAELHPFELLNFIGEWITDHVGRSDVRFGRYLRSLTARAAGD